MTAGMDTLVGLIVASSTGDTWRELLRTTLRRIGVAAASSLTAGYLTPMLTGAVSMSEAAALGAAFTVGAGAQQVLRLAIERFAVKTGEAP